MPVIDGFQIFVDRFPAIAALGAVVLLVLTPIIERIVRGGAGWGAIQRETIDIARHFKSNQSRISEMLDMLSSTNEVPMRMHVQKLQVVERSMLFSDKDLEDLAANRIAIIHRAMVRLRNYNIDVIEALRLLDVGQIDQFSKMLRYLHETNGRLMNWAPRMLEKDDIRGSPIPILGRPAS